VHRDFDRRDPINFPHAICGAVTLNTDDAQYQGHGIYLSLRGITFRAERPPPIGAVGVLALTEEGFPDQITADVRIAEMCGDLVHAIFISAHPAVVRLVAWLSSSERN
jgi:hypothetical protein